MEVPTKEQIKQFYSEAIDKCLTGFAQLSEKEWSKKASKTDTHEWTAHEHLAHLVIAYEVETVPLIRQALAGEPANIPGFESRADMRTFRQSSMESARDVPVPDLLSRLEATLREQQSLLESLSDADLDKPANHPSWDRPATIRDLFFAAYLFLPSQYQEIRTVAKKKLPHWIESSSPDLVHFHLDRTFHYMPLIFDREAAGDLQATYLFTMEGDGGGQWSVVVGDGKAESKNGAPESFDSEIKTKPQLWMDLSSGQLNAPMAIATRKVKLGGNPALAMKLGT
ncbi:MAG: SCP2 sterol-binding domain-containing protein, partial [Dehalococcoidia bacterium]